MWREVHVYEKGEPGHGISSLLTIIKISKLKKIPSLTVYVKLTKTSIAHVKLLLKKFRYGESDDGDHQEIKGLYPTLPFDAATYCNRLPTTYVILLTPSL